MMSKNGDSKFLIDLQIFILTYLLHYLCKYFLFEEIFSRC